MGENGMNNQKIYHFISKKQAKYVRKYNLLKEEKVGFDKLKDLVFALFKSKVTKDKESREMVRANKIIMKKSVNSFFIKMAIAVIIISIVGVLFFNWIAGFKFSSNSAGVISNIDYVIRGSGISSIGLKKEVFTPYVMLTGNVSGVDTVVARMESSTTTLPHTIYILSSKREQATGYGDFIRELSVKLAKYGVALNFITLRDLYSIPNESNAIIIIPTGYIPIELVEGNNLTKPNIVNLVSAGTNILYVGLDYKSGLISNDRGRLVPGDDYNINAIENNLGLEVRAPSAVEGLKLVSPSYSLVPTIPDYESATIYGALSLIKIGKGHLIIVPNSLDGGWTKPADAAEDIAKIILEREWLVAYGEYLGMTPKLPVKVQNGTFSVMLYNKGAADLNSAYGTVYLMGYSGDSKVPAVSYSRYIHFDKNVNGALNGKELMLPEKFVDGPYRLKAYFNEDPEKHKKPVSVLLSLYNSSNDLIYSQLFTKQQIIPVKYDLESNFVPKVISGDYMIRLEDQTGQRFAEMIFRVPHLQLEPYIINWKSGYFAFKLSSDELDVDLTKALKDTSVIVDGKNKYKIMLGSARGENYIYFNTGRLELGKEHTFQFEAVPGLKYKGVSTYVKEVYEEPYFYAGIIIMAVLFGVGYLLRAKDKVKYFVDIPDFQLRKRVKIKLSKSIVLQLFDKINYEYGWKYMPLKLKELKSSGFAKITIAGRPLLITDFNLKLILDELISKGYLFEGLGYYGLMEWVKKTRFTQDYLILYRAIRDILVSNAVRFTKINEAKYSDMQITLKNGIKYELIFGESDPVKKALIALRTNHPVIIIFKSRQDLLIFNEHLYKYGKRVASLMLGMIGDSGQTIKLLDIEGFKKFLNEHNL